MITTSINRGKRPFYNAAEFLCDYQSDVANLPTQKGPGSTAYVVENGNRYVLNGSHQWVLQPAQSSGGGSSTGDTTIIYDGGVVASETEDTIIYDGGVIGGE